MIIQSRNLENILPEKWEYKDVTYEDGETYSAMLNRFGDEGWELVQINYKREQATFKRPKTETLTEVTGDILHRCPSIINSSLVEDNLLYHSSGDPNQSYHYLLLKDRGVVWIGYCPWCGEDI